MRKERYGANSDCLEHGVSAKREAMRASFCNDEGSGSVPALEYTSQPEGTRMAAAGRHGSEIFD